MTTERQRNDGIRKVCDCPRRGWAKCAHPWHFAFKWANEHYRFSLEREVRRIVRGPDGKWRRDRATLGDPITSKTAAEGERDRLRAAIRDGTLQHVSSVAPLREMLTLTQLMETYRRRHVLVNRAGTAKNVTYMLNTIARVELERADGARLPFGDWLVADITTDVVEQFRQARHTAKAGVTGTNRHLELLRHLFGWATSAKRRLAAENPFLDGTQPTVKLAHEARRSRRLRGTEAADLVSVAGPHLAALITAALETGMRRGELLSLQWWQVRTSPRPELFLPSVKTKTLVDRVVPISTQLQQVLDSRRLGPDDEPHGPQAYVFGNDVGEQIKDVKRAWQTAVLKAHGHTPLWATKLKGDRTVRTGELAEESRALYAEIDLHFHDLRREAGSRWLDAGVPLHRIQRWLGHSNISQTSTYLMADAIDDTDAMQRFEEHRARLQRFATDSETGGEKR